MCLTEFNEAETFQALADDYRAEGKAIGEAIGEARGKAIGEAIGEARGEIKGKVGAMVGLVEDGILTVKQAAQQVNMTVPAFKKKVAELKKEKVKA